MSLDEELDFLPTNKIAFLEMMDKQGKGKFYETNKNTKSGSGSESGSGSGSRSGSGSGSGGGSGSGSVHNTGSDSGSESSVSGTDSVDISDSEDSEIEGDYFLKRDFTDRHNKHFFLTLVKWLKILSLYCVKFAKNGKELTLFHKVSMFVYQVFVLVMILWNFFGQLFALLNNTIKNSSGNNLFGIQAIPGFWESSQNTAFSSIGAILFSVIPFICYYFNRKFFKKPHFNNLLRRFFRCSKNGPRLAKYAQRSIKFLYLTPCLFTLISLINYVDPKMRSLIKDKPGVFVFDLLISAVSYWYQFSTICFSIILIIFVFGLHKIHIKEFHNAFTEGHLSIPNAINLHITIKKDLLITGKIFEKFLAAVTAIYLVSAITTIYLAFSDFNSVEYKLIPLCIYLFLILFMLWFPAGISSGCMALVKDLTSIEIVNFTSEKGDELALWYAYLDVWINHPYTGFTLFDFPVYQSTVLRLFYMAGSVLVVIAQSQIKKF
ncbi:p17/29c-like protein [Anaeramoeba flamelloides]|uniref:P17/29c-like protein n=1 Tax=Anaeramoeba flamelloides TaxID=1746091 RepID=A0ABQ8ZDT2_9EUKA|nr:p17/29c-like protein [Anaeramoeba flamelloides]